MEEDNIAASGHNQGPPLAEESGSGFDYSQLEIYDAEFLHTAATAIYGNLRQEIEAATDTGRWLYLVKERLHNRNMLFGAWIKDQFAFSWDTADRYLNIYKRLGDDRFRKLRNEPKKLTTLYELTKPSTPDVVREELAEEANSGRRFTDAEILRRIAEAKEAEAPLRPPSAAQQRTANRQLFAIEAVKFLKKTLQPSGFDEFLRLYRRTEDKYFRESVNARPPEVTIGLVTGGLINETGLPVTDDDLRQLELSNATAPDSDKDEGTDKGS